MTSTEQNNRKYLLWFLIALLIALLPWLVLAQDTKIKKLKFNPKKSLDFFALRADD